MRNLKRLTSMLLAFALVLSIAGIGYFVKDANADSYDQAKVDTFTDINGHWAKNSLANLIGYGYMYGTAPTTASPDEKLTTAQLVTLLVRIMGGAEEADLSGYADMDKGAWYYTYFAQGVNMGIVPNTNSNYLNPNQQSSREYAAYMLCRAFGLTTREPIDDYSDADKVSSWAVTSMQAMVAAKAITGANGQNNTRNLNPQETITRGEFAEMIYRLCKNFVKASDSTNIRGGTIDGGVLISKSGVHLNGVTVKGNVYVSDAVGTGDITFEDAKVEGNIYVRGSGERSVHLEGSTTANSVVFLNPYNATRLVVEDESKINGVLVNNGVDEVTLEGNVGNVTINVSDVDLTFEKAIATNVIVNSARSVVTVDKDSKVDSLTVASSSSGVSVVNEGELTRLALMANDAKLDLGGKVDYLLIGAVSGLDLKLSKDIKLTALDLHCSNSTINVNSEIGSINVSGFSEKLKLEVGKDSKVTTIGISSSSTDLAVATEATVGNVTLDAPKYKGTVSSDLKNLTIGAGAVEAELTLAKDTDIDVLNIYANKVKLIASSGSSVKDVNVTGTEVSITGQGAVANVNIAETANKASVETPNTKVSNAGASEVKAGTVDLPANKAYVTTSTGKDVIRNNDGTPDGDNDKTTGAAQEVATVANYTLTYAANATPADIDTSAKWKLDDLGTGLSLVKNTSAGATYKLTGNVKKVENFLPVFDPIAGYGTGYYVPVVLESDSMATETAYTVETGGVRYTNQQLSKGAGYNGKLIVFLQLTAGTTNKTVSVTFDRDGAGTTYSPVTVSVDYSGVTFDGAQDLTGQLFSYPTNATKQDLTKDGKLELTDFGTMSVAAATGSATYQILGTAAYIEDTPNGNVGGVPADAQGNPVVAHHYVPLMVNTSGFAKDWTVVLDGTTRYTASNVSSGTGCRGHLILLLPVTTNGMTHTIYLDTDGDGRVDADGTYTFNCVGVTLAPKGQGGNNDKEFVEIPEYIAVNLDNENGTVSIVDSSGELYNDTILDRRDATAAEYIESQLNSEGFTNISRERQGSDIVLFRGVKYDSTHVFSWSRSTGITFVGDPQEIPVGTQVEVKESSIVIHDTREELKGKDSALVESIVKKYIQLALTSAGYTDIQQGTSNGVITTYCAKEGTTYRFTTNLTTDVVKEEMQTPAPAIEVEWLVPESEAASKATLPVGSTVSDLLEALGNDVDPGTYFTMSGSQAMKSVAAAAEEELHDGDTVVFGYYCITLPDSDSKSIGDVTLAMTNYETLTSGSSIGLRDGNKVYALRGTELSVDLTIGAFVDNEFDVGIVGDSGLFKLTVSELTLKLDNLPDYSANKGIANIWVVDGNSIAIQTLKDEKISPLQIELPLTLLSDLTCSMTAEAAPTE